jgi:DNA polymerase alpha subunit A
VHVDAMTDVAPLSSSVKQPPAPPLSVMSLSLKTVVNPRTHTHEVVVASILHHRAVSVDGPTNPAAGQLSRITAVAAPVNAGVASLPLDLRDVLASKYPHLQATLKPMPNERALLSFLVARIANLDPDVIVGHNITGFDMDVLLHRIAHNSVPNWVRRARVYTHCLVTQRAAYLNTSSLSHSLYVASRRVTSRRVVFTPRSIRHVLALH